MFFKAFFDPLNQAGMKSLVNYVQPVKFDNFEKAESWFY